MQDHNKGMLSLPPRPTTPCDSEVIKSLDEPLPFAPGTSPFLAKGLIYAYSLKWLHQEFGERFYNALPDEQSRAFFRQPILAGGNYDSFPILHMCATAARLMGKPTNVAIRELTHRHASNDLTTVHRMVLNLVSPKFLADRMTRITDRYWSFGKVEVQESSDNSLHIWRTGLPARMYAYFSVSSVEYTATVLNQFAKGVSVVARQWESDGFQQGVPLIRILFKISWQSA